MNDKIEDFVPENMARHEPPPVRQPEPVFIPQAPSGSVGVTFWRMATAVSVLAAFLMASLLVMGGRKPDAAGWRYDIKDVTLDDHLSGEMYAYDLGQMREGFEQGGHDGWELVSVMPLPMRADRYSPPGRRLKYRLIFKRPGPLVNYERLPYNEAAVRKAIAAESKAESDAHQKVLDEIRAR